MVDLARLWLTECRKSHLFCRPPDPSFNPTRLLFIKDEHTAKLVQTSASDMNLPYVAFSHCWGKTSTRSFKLTRHNMDDMTRNIYIVTLPTSYREAIYISFALGLVHIWIDSLCIVQDDDDDWDREAAAMKDVFENCVLNLSATAAAETSQTSIGHRTPVNFQHAQVNTTWTGLEPRIYNLSTNWEYLRSQEMGASPLHSRAWVYQEAQLCRRRIDLCRSQIWWTCQQTIASETHPEGVPWYRKKRAEYLELSRRNSISRRYFNSCLSPSQPISQLSLLVEDEHGKGFQDKHYTRWWEHVKSYTKCDLSFGKDKLVAFAGIAQRYAQEHGLGLDDYLAGMWWEDLPGGLCFINGGGPRRNTAPPTEYRAPSWSWASCEDFACPPLPSHTVSRSFCRVHSATVILKDPRYQLSEVIGGVLHLGGYLIEYSPFNQESNPPPLYMSREDVSHPFYGTYNADINSVTHDYFSRPSFTPKVVSYLEHSPGQIDRRKEGYIGATQRRTVHFTEWNELLQHLRLFMLPIMIDDDNVGYRDIGCGNYLEWRTVRGLILCQTLDDYSSGTRIYQRVSTFSCEVIPAMLLDVPRQDVWII